MLLVEIKLNLTGSQASSQYLMGEEKAGKARPCFGEYFPESGLGVIFALPDDFLQVYRNKGGENFATFEWMSDPREVAAGQDYDLSFRMRVHQCATAEQFAKEVECP